MHANQQLLKELFSCLNSHDNHGDHDHQGMADCYHDDATFRDIAFDLVGKTQIHAMWRMICTSDERGRKTNIKVEVESLEADDSTGRAVIIDDYTFRLNGNRVRNKIESQFKFSDNKIIEQIDHCDASDWASQAYAGIWLVPGLFLGRIETVRRNSAMKKLRKFAPAAFPTLP